MKTTARNQFAGTVSRVDRGAVPSLVVLAPAGGVTLANALDYAQAGAGFIVISSPHFAPPCDAQIRIAPVP